MPIRSFGGRDAIAIVLALGLAACSGAGAESVGDSNSAVTTTNNLRVFDDATGQTATYTPSGPFDSTNPFFVSLGTNGRVCGTCHDPAANWTVTPAGVRRASRRRTERTRFSARWTARTRRTPTSPRWRPGRPRTACS